MPQFPLLATMLNAQPSILSLFLCRFPKKCTRVISETETVKLESASRNGADCPALSPSTKYKPPPPQIQITIWVIKILPNYSLAASSSKAHPRHLGADVALPPLDHCADLLRLLHHRPVHLLLDPQRLPTRRDSSRVASKSNKKILALTNKI